MVVELVYKYGGIRSGIATWRMVNKSSIISRGVDPEIFKGTFEMLFSLEF